MLIWQSIETIFTYTHTYMLSAAIDLHVDLDSEARCFCFCCYSHLQQHEAIVNELFYNESCIKPKQFALSKAEKYNGYWRGEDGGGKQKKIERERERYDDIQYS